MRLRRASGLSPKTEEQARPALAGSWATCHVVHEASDETVGMAGSSATAPDSIGMDLKLDSTEES